MDTMDNTRVEQQMIQSDPKQKKEAELLRMLSAFGAIPALLGPPCHQRHVEDKQLWA